MKTIFLSVLLFFSHLIIFSQTDYIDSLQHVYRTQNADSTKAQTLYRLGQEYLVFKPGSALLLAQQAYKLASKINDEKSQSRALNVIASVYNKTSNYPKALDFYIKVLKIEENKKDPEFLASTLLNIATVYHSQGDDHKAISFTLRADSLINAKNIEWLKVYSLMNLGFLYEKVNNF
jgi:tetratricopeptide (TPR) repeat protein